MQLMRWVVVGDRGKEGRRGGRRKARCWTSGRLVFTFFCFVQYGGTCLHWAASKGRKEVIQYLCMKGIDIHVTSYVRTLALVRRLLV